MPSLTANGVELFYESKGSGTPVVFVHGIPCDSRGWDPQTSALSSKFRTVAYSRRYSFPNSRKGDLTDSTVQNNAEDLAGLITQLGLAPAHVVGHSYGGFIAAYFALKHPDLLMSLTLVNAAVGPMLVNERSAASQLSLLFRYPGVVGSARRFLSAQKETLKELDAGHADAVVKVFLPGLQNGRTDLPPKPPIFEKMVAANAMTVKESRTLFPHVTKEEVRTVRAPTLVVWGDFSAPWDAKISELLAASIPGAQTAKIPAAGHFCMYEKPDEFNAALLGFLQKIS